ncbi:hypothetical protein [Mycolicibacterium fortuitum]|uniref:hypothetical protein n=1 Tax=Mycolicibacterium fortuitum TaxID=1766 RepID=UPI0010424F44|nr:hypothetical protein [Mycolicibacterium fortuitum]
MSRRRGVYHGSRDFTKLDFENLVGRAGRLTYDFSGNVVCVREEEPRWREKSQELIARAEPGTANSFLVRPKRGRTKEFNDIARVLRGEDLPKFRSADQIRSSQQYASILTLRQIDQQQTPLRSLFLDRVSNSREVLRRATGSIRVPTDVLRRSPDILPEYQNRAWDELNAGAGPLLSS